MTLRRRPSRSFDIRAPLSGVPKWVFVAIAIVLVFVILPLVPFGKPDDAVEEMSFSPEHASVHRTFLRSKTAERRGFFRNRRGRLYPPRSVSLSSDGAPFRAYLLDLSGIDDPGKSVEAFMSATTEIERGREPTTAPVAARAVDVTVAHFKTDRGLSLPGFGGDPLDHMLIVACDAEAVVTVRVSYR